MHGRVQRTAAAAPRARQQRPLTINAALCKRNGRGAAPPPPCLPFHHSPENIIGQHRGQELGLDGGDDQLWMALQGLEERCGRTSDRGRRAVGQRRSGQAACGAPPGPARAHAPGRCFPTPSRRRTSFHHAPRTPRPTNTSLAHPTTTSLAHPAPHPPKNTRVMAGPHTSWSRAILMSTALVLVGASGYTCLS